MNLESSSVLMTNDQQSTTFVVKTGYDTKNGHISQIPGLSPSISAVPEARTRGRRAGVLESDSDYVKLAKQGGHKGLLWHEESVVSKPGSYKPPDWFGFESGGINELSEQTKNPGAFQPLEPPFGTDMSAEDGDNSSNNEQDKDDVPVHHSQAEKLQASSHYRETSKFRRM